MSKELAFASRIAVIPTEMVVGTNDAVTRDDEANWVSMHSAANRTNRHLCKPALGRDNLSNHAVGYGFTKFNLASDFEYARVKRCKAETNWRAKARLLTGEILI